MTPKILPHSRLSIALVGMLAVCGAASAQLAWPEATWPSGDAAAHGFDPAALAGAMAALPGNVFVVKDGYVVAKKGETSKPVPLNSVSKSLTALVAGRLLATGAISLDDPVPGSALPVGPEASVRQFLAMCSDYGLDPHAPGQHHAYNNMAYHRLGEFLRGHFGIVSPQEVLDQALFDTIGRQDPIGFSGLWSGWGAGFALSARDLARVGLLLSRGGKWQEAQHLPPDFVGELFQNQIPPSSQPSTSTGGEPTQGEPGNNWWNQFHLTDLLPGSYSFGFWTNDGLRWPTLPEATIFADGLGGHRLFVVPELDLVVSVTQGGDALAPDEVLAPILGALVPPAPPAEVSGDLEVWHRVTLTWEGPSASETGTPNPFTDYRLDVTFSKDGRTFVVPGHFAADGAALESGAGSGTKWRVHFMPDEPGTWHYQASFRTGPMVAASTDPLAGTPTAFHGSAGSFTVAPSSAPPEDLRARGLLRWDGSARPTFAGDGSVFVQVGARSPENLLAYAGFDQTPATHSFAPHAGDAAPGHPDWHGGDGKNLLGAIDYLASAGVNLLEFLTLNVGGEGDDVFPWIGKGNVHRYDVSKLEQWRLVLEYAQGRGVVPEFVLWEEPMEDLLDAGQLGPQRRLYLRELVARFSHLPGLVWNLGENSQLPHAVRRAIAEHLRALDPYDHPIVAHGQGSTQAAQLDPLAGDPSVDGATLSLDLAVNAHARVLDWLSLSAGAGRPWFVVVEGAGPGSLPDAYDPTHDLERRLVLWGSLTAGATGVAWPFAAGWPEGPLDAEDFGSREELWRQSRLAADFLREHVDLAAAINLDGATVDPSDFVLAVPGKTYLVYRPEGGEAALDLSGEQGIWRVRWWDPVAGGPLRFAGVGSVAGGALVSLGAPPVDDGRDWVCLVERATSPLFLYGEGVPGSSGQVPTVDADDPVLGASDFSVLLDGAPPQATAVCVIGRRTDEEPLFGGTILVEWIGLWSAHTTDGLGRASHALPIPPDPSYAGRSLYFQWWISDEGAPMGVAMTRGLQAILHP